MRPESRHEGIHARLGRLQTALPRCLEVDNLRRHLPQFGTVAAKLPVLVVGCRSIQCPQRRTSSPSRFAPDLRDPRAFVDGRRSVQLRCSIHIANIEGGGALIGKAAHVDALRRTGLLKPEISLGLDHPTHPQHFLRPRLEVV